MTLTQEREELHRLVDEMPDSEVPAARRFLRFLQLTADPIVRAFVDAPEDDEPLTEAEGAAIRAAEDEIARGETIPWDQVKRELEETA
jgi:hypothetical protein